MYLSSQGYKNIALNIVGTPAVRVMVVKVYENNLEQFMRSDRAYCYDYNGGDYEYYNTENLGDTIFQKDYATSKLPKQNAASILHLDFTDRIKDYNGIYVITVASKEHYWLQESKVLSISDIGLIVKAEKDNIYVFANSIHNATNLAGVNVSFISTNNQKLFSTTTDASGVAIFNDISKRAPGFTTGMVTAKQNDEFSFVFLADSKIETSRFDVGGCMPNSTGLNAMMYAERNLYRPGETMHVSTIIRDEQWNTPGEIPVKLKLIMPNGKEFATRRKILNAEGACETLFDIPSTALTGTYTLQALTGNDVLLNTYYLSVEEFMPDRIKVAFKIDKPEYKTGDSVRASIQADNLFGTPASLLYFQKTPDQLSLAEITTLIIIPNRPNSLRIGRNNNVIVVERHKWLHRFQQAKLFPQEIIADALNEPLTAQRKAAPNAVPQFTWRKRRSYPSQTNIHSTIDATIQKKAESIVSNYTAQVKHHNINNAAAIVVNNQTHEVVAYIGSSDFRDRLHDGEVDGVMALRSPGSTLKPLLYGVCFDKGLITPKSMLADVPLNIAGYTPENYDLIFRGAVTAEYALQNSLNIPAVNLLNQYGVNNYITDLREAGLNSVWQNRKNEGLSLILGGCTVRLDEMAAMYRAFANDGNYYPLQWIVNDSIQPHSSTKQLHTKSIHSIPILSAAADYMLTQILSELHRPDLPHVYDAAQDIPKIAWKTGTSYGRKDAWTIGYDKRFTIAVWMGNFSGKGYST